MKEVRNMEAQFEKIEQLLRRLRELRERDQRQLPTEVFGDDEDEDDEALGRTLDEALGAIEAMRAAGTRRRRGG